MSMWPDSILSSAKTHENTLGICKKAPKGPSDCEKQDSLVWWTSIPSIMFEGNQLCSSAAEYIPKVKCAGSSLMLWSCFSAAGTEEHIRVEEKLNAPKYRDSLKVMSNEVDERLLCCGICFPYIYLFLVTNQDIKTDHISKRLRWINMSMYCTFKNQNEAQVFLYHCISEGRLSLENVQCHFHFILLYMPDKAAFVSSALLCLQPLPGKPLFLPL